MFFIRITIALFCWISAAHALEVNEHPLAHWLALRFSSLEKHETRLKQIEQELKGLPLASDLDARGTHGFHSDFTSDSESNWFELHWPSGQWADAIALIPTRINTQSGTFANYGFPRRLKVTVETIDGEYREVAHVSDTRLDLRRGDPLFLSFPRQKIRRLRVIPEDLPELEKKNVRGFSMAECFVFDGKINHAASAKLNASYSIDGEPGWNIRYLTDLQSPLGPPEIGSGGISLGWHSDLRVLAAGIAWIEIDLGKVTAFDHMRLYGAKGDAPLKGPGFGFPQRLRFETREANEDTPVVIWPNEQVDIPNPGYNVLDISIPTTKARYVRLVAEKPDQPDVLTIARVLISEWEILNGDVNIALQGVVRSNDDYESIPHDATRIWSRNGINDGYTSSGKITSYFDWVSGLSRRFDLRVERQAIISQIESIQHRFQNIVSTVLFTVLSVIILYLMVLLRRTLRQNAQRIKQLRMSISSDLHDEVGSNLATISLLADLPQPQGEVAVLKDVQRLARETSLSLREIVDLTLADRPRRPLAERMRDIAKLMLCDHVWQLEAGEVVDLNPLQRRDVIFFYKEVLHNIIQHAEAQSVHIFLGTVGESIKLTIADDGKGFTFDPQKSLLTLHQRAASLEAVLDVKTDPQTGTRLTLVFPRKTKSL